MLFCLTANYTHKALDAMRENPNTNRREAVEKNGSCRRRQAGRDVRHHGRGSGCNGDLRRRPRCGRNGLRNVKVQRLFSGDEVRAIRQKRAQIHASFKLPGQ
jgi:hypothetical protein